jgi:hypothetical protein
MFTIAASVISAAAMGIAIFYCYCEAERIVFIHS